MPANNLNMADFPSMTGIAASGPMSPRPRTAVPSVMMATEFPLLVSTRSSFLSFAIARDANATPGV